MSKGNTMETLPDDISDDDGAVLVEDSGGWLRWFLP